MLLVEVLNYLLGTKQRIERKRNADGRLRAAAEFCREWGVDIRDDGKPFDPAFFEESPFWAFLEALGHRDAVYRQPPNEHLSWNRWYAQGYKEGRQ